MAKGTCSCCSVGGTVAFVCGAVYDYILRIWYPKYKSDIQFIHAPACALAHVTRVWWRVVHSMFGYTQTEALNYIKLVYDSTMTTAILKNVHPTIATTTTTTKIQHTITNQQWKIWWKIIKDRASQIEWVAKKKWWLMIYVFIKKIHEHIETSSNLDAFFTSHFCCVSHLARFLFLILSLSPSRWT